MKYQAIIFDLDGTAIPNQLDGMPSDELIHVIAENKNRMKLCAATGRAITAAGHILEALGLTEPCVISAGTQIVNPKTNEILWEALLNKADVEKVYEVCTPYHYEILIRNELVGEGGAAKHRTAENGVNVLYIMGCAQTDAEIILEELRKIPNIIAAGVTSWTHGGIDIHVTNKDATKEHAITALLELIGASKERTIGVGDANNDIHLFKAVGHKIAMGNATDLLKSQADEICENVDNNGLAHIISKYAM